MLDSINSHTYFSDFYWLIENFVFRYCNLIYYYIIYAIMLIILYDEIMLIGRFFLLYDRLKKKTKLL